MKGNVIQFSDYLDLPLEGVASLAARRALRAGCKEIAADAVAQAFNQTCKIPGVGKVDCFVAQRVFVAAMRRELRKSGLF